MSRQSVQISYDCLNAAPVILASHKHLHLYLVGVGGTGGWLAPTLVRLTKILTDQGRSVSLTLIDYDHVEKVNIPRQNFTQADLGLNKAQVPSISSRMLLSQRTQRSLELCLLPDYLQIPRQHFQKRLSRSTKISCEIEKRLTDTDTSMRSLEALSHQTLR